jgi:alkylation response protein AidB-like acyl-CoA dehydrogenase
MDFELSENQAVIQASVQSILQPFRTLPTGEPDYFKSVPALEQQLAESGFLDVEWSEDYTRLDAALLIYEVSRLPVVLELAASTLVMPSIGARMLARPVALAERKDGPIRFLPAARTLVYLENGEAHIASFQGMVVETLSGVLAYPYGRLVDSGSLKGSSLGPGSGESLRCWWRVALALEAAGQLRGALEATVDYVSQRKQFGRPIGSFQAVQHRLANALQVSEACRWLALRAAESGAPEEAAIAALYAQDQMRTVITDLHQFTGAIGLTQEYPLHYWTYRLKALQGELGGMAEQAQAASKVFDLAAH